MTSLTGDQSATASTPAAAFTPAIRRQDYQPVICGLTLLAAECVAAAAATLLAAAAVKMAWGGVGVFARPGSWPALPDLAVLFVAIIAYLGIKGRYSERVPFWTETRLVVSATFWAVATAAAVVMLTNDVFAGRLALTALLVFPALAITANRLAKHILSGAGLWARPIVVIGDGPTAAEAELALGSDRSLGYRFVGRLDPVALMAAPAVLRLWAVLGRYHARSLLIAVDVDVELQRQVIECALREKVPFAVVPPPRAFPAFGCDSTRLFSHDTMLLSYRDRLSHPSNRFVKAAIDVAGAMALLVLLLPLFLVIAIIIRLDGGPTFFAHRRVGARGQPFKCLKFRTMVIDGERTLRDVLGQDAALAAEWSKTRKLVRDPRVTRIGRFLRRTSLDELPQLINVLRLEMSLVGPRPIVESEVPLYGEQIAHYYATRPGMTGLWQVSGRSNTSYARRVQLDVWYVNNWSVWHDVAVLLKTVPAVMGRRGAC